jgi:hypothetical protein
MEHSIVANPKSYDTNSWNVAFDDGRFICAIRLVISSMLNGSRYYVLDEEGGVIKEGTFNFEVWDHAAVRDTVTAIVRSMYPTADVTVNSNAPRLAQ